MNPPGPTSALQELTQPDGGQQEYSPSGILELVSEAIIASDQVSGEAGQAPLVPTVDEVSEHQSRGVRNQASKAAPGYHQGAAREPWPRLVVVAALVEGSPGTELQQRPVVVIEYEGLSLADAPQKGEQRSSWRDHSAGQPEPLGAIRPGANVQVEAS
jgi:hypothetical protein